MRTISVANHKGGVGKSATAEHLAWLFANRFGLRVLLIDMDPQGSLTEAMGVTDAEGSSMSEVLGGSDHPAKKIKAILRDLGGGLWLAPADIAMAVSEHALASRPLGRELVLQKTLEPIAPMFDMCWIDCPPSLSQLTYNSLFASDAVLIPTGATPKDLRGLRLFRETLDLMRPYHPLVELGVVLTMFQSQLRLHQRVLAELEAADRQGVMHLFKTRIGKSIRMSEAEEVGRPLFEYQGSNPRAAEYESLAQEVAECLQIEAHASPELA